MSRCIFLVLYLCVHICLVYLSCTYIYIYVMLSIYLYAYRDLSCLYEKRGQPCSWQVRCCVEVNMPVCRKYTVNMPRSDLPASSMPAANRSPWMHSSVGVMYLAHGWDISATQSGGTLRQHVSSWRCRKHRIFTCQLHTLPAWLRPNDLCVWRRDR